VITKASCGNSKAHTSPSLPHSERNRIASSGGTRRNAEVRLTLAGSRATSRSHRDPAVMLIDQLKEIYINGELLAR
jgi:hypothetical protein